MKTFKFWVNAAIVVATITSVVGVIAFMIFQFMYGWHTDPLSTVEVLIRNGVRYGFGITGYCIVFATVKLLLMVYNGELLIKEPSKPFKEEPIGLVKRVEKVLATKGFDFEYAIDTEIIKYARSVLEAKNIPIPKKDEDLWKLIEPKVKQYEKPATPDESVSKPSHRQQSLDRVKKVAENNGCNLTTAQLSAVLDRALEKLHSFILPDDDAELWHLVSDDCVNIRLFRNSMIMEQQTTCLCDESFEHKRGGNPNSIFDPVKEQPSDDLVKEPWVGGVETPAYKSVKDRLTEVAQTPTQDGGGLTHPGLSVRHRLDSILRDHGCMGEYGLVSLYDYILVRTSGLTLDRYSDEEIWGIIQSAVLSLETSM